MKKITIVFFLGLLLIQFKDCLYGQDQDFSLAKVGKKIYGVYVFFGCEPANQYTYVKTIEVKIDWSDSFYDSFERVIEKAKRKESNFNGIIFQTENLNKADLIRFNDLEASRGGFSYGSKASFIDYDQVFVGEIVELETSRGYATIRYKNIYFEDEIKKISYTKLTPISDEVYQEKQKEIEQKSENYIFQIGEKVNWITENLINKKQFTGEIVKLDNKLHKAIIKYLNAENKEAIATVSYTNINKLD